MLKNRILIAAAAFIATIILIISFIIFSKYYWGKLTITCYPEGVKFSIDGKDYHGSIKEERVRAKKYNVSFSETGFKTKTEVITVRGNSNNAFEIILYPSVNIKGFENLSDDDKKQAITDYWVENKASDFLKNYPLQKHLPYQGDNFSVDYQLEKNDQVKTVVTLYAKNSSEENSAKKSALTWLSDRIGNTSKLQIGYIVQAPADIE